MKKAFIAGLLLWSAWIQAQEVTTTDVLGDTVIELITDIPGIGLTTETLQTLTASSTTTSSTTTPLNQGNVPTPAPLPEAGIPTPFTYTTTNAAGGVIVEQGVFTPTGPATVLPSPTTTGTILDYNSWLSMVGTYTQPAQYISASSSWKFAGGWYGLALSSVACLASGVLTVMM